MTELHGLRRGYADMEDDSVGSPQHDDEPPPGEDRPHEGHVGAVEDDNEEDHELTPYRPGRGARASGYAPPSLPEPPRYGGSPRNPGILSPEAAATAESAFTRLADTLMSRATSERSIEDITRELLRPMLKQWLDEHLPSLVERLVREEIERVARRGGR
jgi:cell pole-organizing protein PopZ